MSNYIESEIESIFDHCSNFMNVDRVRAELASLRAAAAEREELKRTIEAQAAQLEQARNVIEPFAKLGDVFTKQDKYDDSIWTKIPDDDLITCGWKHLVVRVRDFRSAAIWLAANAPAPEEERTK